VLLAGHRIPFPRLVRFELTAQGASAVSPEGSGELIRIAQLQSEGLRASTTLSVIAVRKLLSSVGLVPLLAVLLWAPAGLIPGWGPVVVAAYVLVMIVLVVAVLVVAAGTLTHPSLVAQGEKRCRGCAASRTDCTTEWHPCVIRAWSSPRSGRR